MTETPLAEVIADSKPQHKHPSPALAAYKVKMTEATDAAMRSGRFSCRRAARKAIRRGKA